MQKRREEKRRKEDKSYESLDGIRSQGDHLFLFFFCLSVQQLWGVGVGIEPPTSREGEHSNTR